MTKPQNTAAAERDEFQEKTEKAAAMALPDAPAPETDDLPDEVKAQLIGYDEIELENQLFDCVKSIGKYPATVDKIIVALWHRHKKTEQRHKIITKLNAMSDTGRILKQTSPRGYCLPTTEASE